MAKKSIIDQIQPMAGRPATKIEIEAAGAICNLQDELREAKLIILALLGISSLPQSEADKANARERAIEFLKR